MPSYEANLPCGMVILFLPLLASMEIIRTEEQKIKDRGLALALSQSEATERTEEHILDNKDRRT